VTALPGWALFVPIAIFNFAVGLWTLRSAAAHARYLREQAGGDDPFFAQYSDHPDFPGAAETKRQRLRGWVLILSGIVILLLWMTMR
jgi:hypothetical protein